MIQTWADWFKRGRGWAADFILRPPTWTASNFKSLWSTDSIFTVLKDLNLLKKYIKNQEAHYNFRLGFALSNRPYFNSAYLLRVPFSSSIALPVDSEEMFHLLNICNILLIKNVFYIFDRIWRPWWSWKAWKGSIRFKWKEIQCGLWLNIQIMWYQLYLTSKF